MKGHLHRVEERKPTNPGGLRCESPAWQSDPVQNKSANLGDLPKTHRISLFEDIYAGASSSKKMAKKKGKKSSRNAKAKTGKRRVVKRNQVEAPAAAPATPQLASKAHSDVHSPYR